MMADIQLYTGERDDYYSSEQISELNKPLDQRLVSKRKGGGGRMLSYIEGHDAIDQANRIFGYGNWGYRPLSLEQVVLIDPIDGVAVGIEYKALVELTVRGAIAPIVDVGSQPVATWSVEDQVMGRRVNEAKYNHKEVDESPFTLLEKRNARAVIVEAHEQAKKGAVTDALKRCLRAYGNQFGNGLYGDGHVDLDEPAPGTRVVEERPRQIAAPTRQQANNQRPSTPATRTAQPANAGNAEPIDETPATEAQIASMRKLYEHFGLQMPKRSLTYAQAKKAIQKAEEELRKERDAEAVPLDQVSAEMAQKAAVQV